MAVDFGLKDQERFLTPFFLPLLILCVLLFMGSGPPGRNWSLFACQIFSKSPPLYQ
jgi:hypothetical protein